MTTNALHLAETINDLSEITDPKLREAYEPELIVQTDLGSQTLGQAICAFLATEKGLQFLGRKTADREPGEFVRRIKALAPN